MLLVRHPRMRHQAAARRAVHARPGPVAGWRAQRGLRRPRQRGGGRLVAAGAVMFALAVTAAAPRHRLGWLAMSGSAAFVGADARMRWHDAWPHGDFLVHVVMLGTFAVGSVLVAR